MFNLRQEILKEHSKAQCNKIVHWIGSEQKHFDTLFNLFLNDEYRVVQRAAWPLSNSVMQHPILIQKHWVKLLKNLRKDNLHDAVKRNTLRLMQYIYIPEKYHGDIMNICFVLIESPDEAVAVKVFALTVLEKLAAYYPEIIPEIKIIAEDQLPYQTVAFKSKVKKLAALWKK